MLQAQCGYMDLTGNPDGPPMQNGPPIIDLKAGDELFAQVLLALLEGGGRRIDVSMGQAAVSSTRKSGSFVSSSHAPQVPAARSGSKCSATSSASR